MRRASETDRRRRENILPELRALEDPLDAEGRRRRREILVELKRPGSVERVLRDSWSEEEQEAARKRNEERARKHRRRLAEDDEGDPDADEE
jgi:hypothetical protein